MRKRLNFKQLIRQDAKNVFLNQLEFADEREVNGHKMPVIIDTNELEDREKRYKGDLADGIYRKQLLIYVLASKFGRMPTIGSLLTLDGYRYKVTSAINEDGIYSLELEGNRSKT